MSALTDTFTNIANAIRAKTGKSELIKPVDMADAIAAIPSGGGGRIKMITRTVTNPGWDTPCIIDFSDLSNVDYITFNYSGSGNYSGTFDVIDQFVQLPTRTNSSFATGSVTFSPETDATTKYPITTSFITTLTGYVTIIGSTIYTNKTLTLTFTPTSISMTEHSNGQNTDNPSKFTLTATIYYLE